MNKTIFKTALLFCICLYASIANAGNINIVHSKNAEACEKWAAKELATILGEIYEKEEFSVSTTIPKKGKYILLGTLENQKQLSTFVKAKDLEKEGSFVVTHTKSVGIIAGNNPRAVLDGVYSLLEQKLGYGFYLHTNAKENVVNEKFSFERWDLAAQPEFQERVIFNWYNFISGVSGWNMEDYKEWIRQAARMRYTSVMLHAYAWSPFNEFTYNGVTKPVLRIQNTQYGSWWDNKQVEDVREIIGGEHFEKEGPVFGADVSKIGYNGVTYENRVAKAKELMRQVVSYAVDSVGMEFNWAFDIDTRYANPQNIIQSLPEKDRIQFYNDYLARPDTEEGYKYFKHIISTVMNDYPGISTVTVWWRSNDARMWDGLINSLPAKERTAGLPDEWMDEYNAAPQEIKGTVTEGGNTLAPSALYYAKVTDAFRKALDEMGHDDVEIGYGSWVRAVEKYNCFIPANYFQAPENKAYALEYNMMFDTDLRFRKWLAESGSKRDLVVIEWAHHDDGKYLGRPYSAVTDFADKLHESKASGFGVIHWMTRPFDIFFKNMQNQVWSNTLNESYATTCDKMALDYFGAAQAEAMSHYLKKWWETAPQFGRETGYLGQTGVENHDERIALCDDRIAMLSQIDTSKLSLDALMRYKYFYGIEEWMKLFHQSQINWDIDLQKQTIQKYIEHTSYGNGMTRGEEGILIQHNIKWLDTQKEHEWMMKKH